jgi:TolB-like protein/Tfp pilus assembly protein PilF
MSRVFLAHEPTLGRDVVVKVLPPDLAADVSVERFEREIQVAARLQHPHIVPVLSAGNSAGLPYLVMPYIAGESLRAKLQRERELPIGEAVRILRDVALALQYAHTRGIVHRDIKPENILLTDGTAVVTDFGVAKALVASTDADHERTLTSVGLALGTPAYMAPEQAAGDPATDHRADIYAWATLAYEMLTGSAPFTGRSPQATFAAHMTEAVKPLGVLRPGVTPVLANLVMRGVEKRPADRPQSAAELVQTLDLVVSTGTITPQPVTYTPAPRRMLTYAVVAAIAVALAGVALWLRRDGSAPSAGVTSIAVLPFVDAGVGGDDYFAEGMSDELSAALGRIPGLQVASRTSTFAFRGESVDVRQVGSRLKVDAVLEGRVRRAGDRLRVTAQLTDAGTGLSLWTDAFEREQRDVFAVQDDIARAIASALQVRLASTGAASGTAARGTSDLEAYDLYLRGRYFWHRRGAENLRTAIGYFERAIQRDPDFARAHAGLAIAAVLLPEYSDSAVAGLEARGEAAARRALALDSTLAEANAAIGLARVHAWDWDAAERAYRRAVADDPRYATGHQWLGELLYTTDRVDESIAEMRTATELDPLAPIHAAALGYVYMVARRYDESLASVRRGLEIAPTLGIHHRLAAFAYLFAGDRSRALAHARQMVEYDPELLLRRGQFVYVAARAGRRDLADAAFAELARTRQWQNNGAFVFAYLGRGDRDRALQALEQAVDDHDQFISSYGLLNDPTWDELRADPRFQRVLERVGLARFTRR